MSNPFAINQLSAFTQPAAAVSNPYIGGSAAGGAGSIFTPQTGPQAGPKAGGLNAQQGLNEVAMIGASKAEGFQNGLGGTNNPDDHKLFLTA